MTKIDPDASSESWLRRLDQCSPNTPSWEALSNRYDLRLRVFAAQLLGPVLRRNLDPEDVVNEAWLRIANDLDGFESRGQDALFSWMCLRVRRVIADLARRQAKEGPPTQDGISQVPGPSEHQPPQNAAQRELETAMSESLESLPRTYKEVLVARLIEGRAYAEISAATGVRENTLAQQLARGLELWRRALGQDPLTWI